jgi:hypothetical protein
VELSGRFANCLTLGIQSVTRLLEVLDLPEHSYFGIGKRESMKPVLNDWPRNDLVVCIFSDQAPRAGSKWELVSSYHFARCDEISASIGIWHEVTPSSFIRRLTFLNDSALFAVIYRSLNPKILFRERLSNLESLDELRFRLQHLAQQRIELPFINLHGVDSGRNLQQYICTNHLMPRTA